MVLGRIGLTGATGMFGCHMRAALEAAGALVVPVSRSGRCGTAQWDMAEWVTDDVLDALFGGVQAVIHAGATLDSDVAKNGARIFDVNVRACVNLAEWALSRSVPLVYISSASVYADPDSGHLSEDAQLGVNQLGGFYGMTKLLAEDILARYRSRGLKLAVVRPSSLYGFGGPVSKTLYKFLYLASQGKIIDLAPPVDDCVDFVHAADLSSAVVRVIESDCWDTFNIASERPISIHELAHACVEVAGRGSIRVLKTEQVDRQLVRRFFLDAHAARERLGWSPTIGIRQGLKMVLAGQFAVV